MSHAAKIGTAEVIWIGDRKVPDGYVRYVGDVSEHMAWDAVLGNVRLLTRDELLQVEAAESAKRVESDTARDDAKRALAALDTIIAGIDGASLAQAKAAIKQEAQILKHIILAVVGR